MAETSHHHVPTPDPVESDGVAYRGIGWFLVILVLTVMASQLIVWGVFEWFSYRMTRSEAPRAVMADPQTSPVIEGGRIVSGAEGSPTPALLVREPDVLGDFNARQNEALHSYGWINQGMGTVRLPIDRAKDLVLERGLPVRPDPAAAPAPDGATPEGAAAAQP